MRRTLAITAVALLAVTACGSDGDSDGDSGSVQDQAADQAIAEAAESDVTLDADCVREAASKLSDDDAQAILDAGPDGDAELSPEGEAVSSELISCVPTDDLADLFIDGLDDSGQEFDEDCVREQLDALDPSVLADVGDETPEELVTALLQCADLGG
jgi:hypothetical protein